MTRRFNSARLVAASRDWSRACVGLIVLICLTVLLTACVAANTEALEPQNRSLDGRQARLYFVRHANAVAGLMTYPTVSLKVDGKPVGSLATGAFIFVDRPGGLHTINVAGSVHDKTGFETEIQVDAGRSYYFEIGPIVRINNDGFVRAIMEVSGRPLTGRYSDHSGFMFYSLDVSAGEAAVANLNGKK
jgi:Protein of unknown function (DUF2846)